MNRPRFLYISIISILLYWIVAVVRSTGSVFQAPDVLNLLLMKTIYLAVICGLLWLNQDTPGSIGFRRDFLVRKILVGAGIGAIFWIFIHLIFQPAIAALLPPKNPSAIDMSIYFKDPASMLIWLFIGVYGGGLVEELQRIFIMTRFELQWGRMGLIIAIIVHAVIFGMGHLYQGSATAIGTGVLGIMNSLVYLRRRSALETISCHAFFDVIGILLAFFINH